MEKRKTVVDLQQIDLLEQKIVKATELIRSLRREREVALRQAREAADELARVRKEAAAVERDRTQLREVSEQIEALREERQAVRGKVQRMLEIMACLDEAPAEARGDH
ncbi:MAG: hypothetical protein ACE5JH_08130 [Acidobacteriota bacterium]